jgi:Na+-transporting methylmalonyl-CoA/oxaloacetate decarboxylase gamma subunit
MGPETVDWGYAISTLVIRFVGIFIVLGILQVVMQVTGRVFARLDARQKDAPLTPSASEAKELTGQEAAAVAMALYLYDKRP